MSRLEQASATLSGVEDRNAETLDTLTRSAVFSTDDETDAPLLPGLTIMAHPELDRIGERTALPQLGSSQPIELSRLTPLFAEPGSGRGRPLADPHISRKPLLLRLDGDELELRNTQGLRAELQGQPLGQLQRLPASALDRGIRLTLAGRVVLLLHRLEFAPDAGARGRLIGESVGMQRLRRAIRQVADLDVPVLLRGETGTGKELVATQIFEASRRRGAAMVAVNMGAVPPTLAAAELFGSSKGAFTGADRRRDGYFVQADGGTLFLDEIGETPPEVQPLLLRTLETGVVRPVGSAAERRVDVRILAATDADLEYEIETGRFRAPLLHRLAGYEIHLPPLRERREDIPRLMMHFLRQELAAIGEDWRLESRGRTPWLTASTVQRFLDYPWPGNVRQLRNLTRQLVIANRGASHARLTREIEAQLENTPLQGTARLQAEVPVSTSDQSAPARASTANAETGADRPVVRTVVALRWRGAPNDTDVAEFRLQSARDRLVRGHLADFDGNEIERGGGFLLLFSRTSDALGFVLEVHSGLRELESPQLAAAALFVGEVSLRRNASSIIARGAGRFDIAGPAKLEARRLAEIALDGQTLLNRSAFELARQALGDEHSLNGDRVVWLEHGAVDDFSDVCEVGLRGSAPLTHPAPAQSPAQEKKPYRSPAEVDEEELIRELRRFAYRLQPTAKALGISRTSLYALIEKSTRIRKAGEISREEILATSAEFDGDRAAMASALEVSRKGLSRRMTELGL